MKKLIIMFVSLFFLFGCSEVDFINDNGKSSCGETIKYDDPWPDEINWEYTISDDIDDFVYHGNEVGPSPIIPYEPVDLNEVKIAIDNKYLYVQFKYNGIIPIQSQKIEANDEINYIHSQAMNVAINADYGLETEGNQTGTLWGVDAFFAISIDYYNQCASAYAPYKFSSDDIHSIEDSIYGEIHPTIRGLGGDTVIARYDITLIKDYFHDGVEMQIDGWAETESFNEEEFDYSLEAKYHEFAHDDLTRSYFTYNENK